MQDLDLERVTNVGAISAISVFMRLCYSPGRRQNWPSSDKGMSLINSLCEPLMAEGEPFLAGLELHHA